ncbi:hypothetical protein EJB05_45645, partial [Eragrostis curvula]
MKLLALHHRVPGVLLLPKGGLAAPAARGHADGAPLPRTTWMPRPAHCQAQDAGRAMTLSPVAAAPWNFDADAAPGIVDVRATQPSPERPRRHGLIHGRSRIGEENGNHSPAAAVLTVARVVPASGSGGSRTGGEVHAAGGGGDWIAARVAQADDAGAVAYFNFKTLCHCDL